MKTEVIVIENEQDHQAAKELLHSLMGAETPEAVARLQAQALLIQAWEREQYPVLPPDPVDAIIFRMEQMGLKPKDLRPALGSPSRVTEVLHRNRKLTLAMIRRLHNELGIPAETLIREPRPLAG